MGNMVRKAFALRLKPGSLDQYIYWHNNIWPELKEEIARQGIAEIILYQIDDQVFLFSSVKDEGAWNRLWESELHHRWAREHMEPLMHYRDDGVVDAVEMREIWHFNPEDKV